MSYPSLLVHYSFALLTSSLLLLRPFALTHLCLIPPTLSHRTEYRTSTVVRLALLLSLPYLRRGVLLLRLSCLGLSPSDSSQVLIALISPLTFLLRPFSLSPLLSDHSSHYPLVAWLASLLSRLIWLSPYQALASLASSSSHTSSDSRLARLSYLCLLSLPHLERA